MSKWISLEDISVEGKSVENMSIEKELQCNTDLFVWCNLNVFLIFCDIHELSEDFVPIWSWYIYWYYY